LSNTASDRITRSLRLETKCRSLQGDKEMKLTIALLFTLLVCAANVSAQNTEFTYQGSLKDGVLPANGSYDFKFRLFDVVSGGAEIASTDAQGIAVSNGIFTVRLDFGSSAFREAPRFLEILVKPAGGPTFVTLTPRQPVTSAPHAIKSLSADSAQTANFANTATDATNAARADGLSAACIGCVSDANIGNSISGSKVSGLIPVASVPPGSPNYIHNSGVVQGGDFNIDGDGTAFLFNARAEFQINGQHVFSVRGSASTLAGIRAGAFSTGDSNTIMGRNAGGGPANSGNANSFFGLSAGQSNTSGGSNSFFGAQAGLTNMVGQNNSFFGRSAGLANTATNNSFFGAEAGAANVTGTSNAFFGYRAGFANTAIGNSFFGTLAGSSNTSGVLNAFFGNNAGAANTTGDSNTFVGYFAGANNTASSNSFFGTRAGDVNTSGASNSFFGANAGGANTIGSGNTFVGIDAGEANTTGGSNIFVGFNAGNLNTTGVANILIGTNAGNTNATGGFNTVIGFGADVASNDLQFATAIGANAVVSENNTIVIGRATDKTSVSVLQITGGSDLAENFEIDGKAEPGMVVAIDPNNAGQMVVSRRAYNRRVAGIISGANKLSTGMLLPNLDRSKPSSPIALAGRVWVFADASTGAIKPGDLLTTSPTAGHAMKVKNYRRGQGAIIGKAMSSLKSGRGMVLVLISMQ